MSENRSQAIASLLASKDVVFKTAMMIVWSGLGIASNVPLSYDSNETPRFSQETLTVEARRKFRKLFRKFYNIAVKSQSTLKTYQNDCLFLIKQRPALASLQEFPLDGINVFGYNFYRAALIPIDIKLEKELPAWVKRARIDFVTAYVQAVLVYDLYKKMSKSAPTFTKKK